MNHIPIIENKKLIQLECEKNINKKKITTVNYEIKGCNTILSLQTKLQVTSKQKSLLGFFQPLARYENLVTKQK